MECDTHVMHKSCRFQLEQDVQKLQKLLNQELELHAVLENAWEHAAVTLSDLSCLPANAQELLSDIAMLEMMISRLEEEMTSLHFQLIQERNERRLTEYHLKQLSSRELLMDCPENVVAHCVNLKSTTSDVRQTAQDMSCKVEGGSPPKLTSNTSIPTLTTKHRFGDMGMKDENSFSAIFEHTAIGRVAKYIPVKGLSSDPNLLSQEMVRCMKNIFISLANISTVTSKPSSSESLYQMSSPHGNFSTASFWALSEPSTISPRVQSPQVDLRFADRVLSTGNAFDPYKVRGKLSWKDIGNYSLAIEVSWMSVGKKQLEYAAGALKRFRLLIEQLAKVNPVQLTGNSKLAFWINVYNALIMHAYLAYGVPNNDLKLSSLMRKAAYTIGGHSCSAACIELVILKMKPPAYRPQTALLLALQKLRVSEEQKKFSVKAAKPLVAFALSCGLYSSPAVRIYTCESLSEQLQEARQDFIRASVGVSDKGKLLVPKMLHCYARGFVDEANVAAWIARFLPQKQAAFVEQCISQRQQSFLGSHSCSILPFDSRFRYLLLPEISPLFDSSNYPMTCSKQLHRSC